MYALLWHGNQKQTTNETHTLTDLYLAPNDTEYTVAIECSPYNEVFLGLVLESVPELMEMAEDTVLLDKTLIAKFDEWFFTISPVYQFGLPQGTAADRRNALSGYSLGALNLDGILEAVFEDNSDNHDIVRMTAFYQGDLLLAQHGTVITEEQSALELSQTFTVGGLEFLMTMQQVLKEDTSGLVFFLIVLCCAFVAAGTAITAIGRSQAMEGVITSRTSTLAELNKSLIAEAKARREMESSQAEDKAALQTLLAKTFPRYMVARLNNEGPHADRYENITVVTTNISGVLNAIASRPPESVAGLFADIWSLFDDVADSLELERVGADHCSYTVVAGLPNPSVDHADRALKYAFAVFQRFHSVFPDLHCTVGVASGSLVAGRIGTTRIRYDAWGATRTVARTLAHSGKPGEVLATQSTLTARQSRDKLPVNDTRTLAVEDLGSVTCTIVNRV